MPRQRDALSSSATKSYLLPLTLAFEEDNDERPQPAGGRVLTRVASMPDVKFIKEMAQFGEDVDALSGKHPAASPPTDKIKSAAASAGNVNGGFCIGSSDRVGGDQPPRLSPDSALCVSRQASVRSSTDGDIQRAMSRMKIGLPCPKQQGDIPAISEEGQSKGIRAIKSADVGLTNNRRLPSRRSSASPKPLRSSLKGSSGNLRSSLRSSLKSTSSDHMDASGHSIKITKTDSMDVSGHSIESNTKTMKRNVSFSSLEIRSYNVTLGDAPTSSGPPISLDWEYDPAATERHEVDEYEEIKPDRRRKDELLIPPSHRHYLLMRDAGFSRGQIKGAMEDARRVARQRDRTAKGVKYGLQPLEEALEKTRSRFAFSRRKGR